MLLERVRIEFELRISDFTDIGLRGPKHLEASVVKIWFDEASTMDLIYGRFLSQDSNFHVQLCSEDKRSIR